MEIKCKRRSLQLEKLRLGVKGIIALPAFHFKIIVRVKLQKIKDLSM